MMSTSSDAIPAPLPRRLRLMDYLGIFFGITTVASLALAYYWHAQSVEERAPTYYVSPARARIVDTSVPAPPQLRVLYDGKDLNANVNAVIVYVWNDGRLPIRGAQDVLEDLKIHLDPGGEIIDARLLKESRAVTQFVFGTPSATSKNTIPVIFSILEHNDGAALQIIYTGKPDAAVSVTGTIVGPGSPREILNQEPRPIDRRHLMSLILITEAVIAALFAVTVVLFFVRTRQRKMPMHGRELASVALVIGINFALLSYMAYDLHRKSQPVVPPTVWMNQ